MASDIQIANLALSAAGARATIASLQEQSNEAATVALHYDLARDEILRAVHWNFARMQTSLAVIIDGTQAGQTPPQPWLYEYALPSDCVQARYILPMFDAVPGTVPGTVTVPPYMGPTVRFLVTSDNDQGGNPITVILSNQPSAILVYTRRITQAAQFDPLFAQAFAHLLASRITMAISGDKALAKQCFQVAQDTITRARAANGDEGITVIDNTPDWMRVRGYASDWCYPDGGLFFYGPNNLTMVS